MPGIYIVRRCEGIKHLTLLAFNDKMNVFNEVNSDGEVIVVPVVQIPVSQKGFWTKEWQEDEEEADADIKAGRIKSFAEDEDPIAWLNSVKSDEWLEEDK